MRAKIIKIGNFKGTMLSKQMLNLYQFENEVELITNQEGILIKLVKDRPRKDWERQFEEAKATGDEADGELLEGFENECDKSEWKWQLNDLRFGW